jgi:hypothetical protein
MDRANTDKNVQFLMPHFGRRTLYLYGQLAMFILLVVIGGLGIPAVSSSTGWAIGALLLVLTFTYGSFTHLHLSSASN